jgi:DNA-directed RNA polymerase specialized sigma subunit
VDDLKEQKKKEVSIFEKWRKTQDQTHFRELYTSMKNMIHSAARKASFRSNLPESAHRVWAANSFYDALRTFDPKGGRALQSHVYDAVHQKAKRLNYKYQNLGSMPEPRAQIVGLYQNEYGNLKSSLGREPSAAELSDRLHISLKEVTTIQKEISKDLAIGEGTEEVAFAEGSRDEERANYAYYDCSSEEKVVFEYLFGKYGKPRLVKANNKPDFEAIAQRMGVSPSKVRTIFAGVRDKIEKALK